MDITTTPNSLIHPDCREPKIEEPGISPKEKVGRLVPWLATIENTAQYRWLLEMCQVFFDFKDDRITEANWESLYDHSLQKMQTPDWEETVLERSGLDQVYLTNEFDETLKGFDTRKYVPCLRTDDLVFHLTKATRSGTTAESDRRQSGRFRSLQTGDRKTIRSFQVAWCARVCDFVAAGFFTVLSL